MFSFGRYLKNITERFVDRFGVINHDAILWQVACFWYFAEHSHETDKSVGVFDLCYSSFQLAKQAD